MNSVTSKAGQPAVHSTSTTSQTEEPKQAETKSEPEKAAPATTQSRSTDRAKVAEKTMSGQLREEQIRSQLIKGSNKPLEQIQQNFQSRFNALSANKQEFHNLMKEVYGGNYDSASAESFRLRAQKGDYSWLPKIEVKDDRTLKGANGAFDSSSNAVYINEKLLSNPAKAAQVFSEEVGHFLDTKLKTTDTTGDEGEMFRRLLAGEKLSAEQKAQIRADNDQGTISVNGKSKQVEFDNSAVVDNPQVNLSAEADKRWKATYQEMLVFQGKLNSAESKSLPKTTQRGEWLNELQMLQLKLAQVTTESGLAEVQASFSQWEKKIYAATAKADEEWHNIADQSKEEQSRLMEDSSVAGIYALDENVKLHNKTKEKMDKIDSDFRVPEDYQELKNQIGKNEHLWLGELKAARGRVKELKNMLDVVGSIRSAGEKDDKLVPNWKQRVNSEINRLTQLAMAAPTQETRIEIEREKKDLQDSLTRAQDSKPRKKGIAEKGFDLVTGAISAVVDPVVEGAKQYIDLQQIVLHYTTWTLYEPTFISDTSKAAKQGATTSDLLKGMAKGLAETPERFYKAIENDDWNAIGREGVNLYLLAKTGKDGAAKAASMIRLAKARAAASAGLEGGMGAAAALETLKLAKKENLVIRYRMNEPVTIALREKGHPAKPEFLKMKTIKEADTYLGASEADLGKVGYFEPKRPSNLKSLEPKLQAEINARYDARMKEWTKYKAEVNEMVKKGLIKHEGNLIVDPKTGKAFTGDYDLFDIRQGGTKGPSVEFESLPKRVQDKMKGKPIESQHGAHLDWKEIPAGSAEVFAEIVLAARPRPGAKPLIEFHPDGRIRYTYFTD